MNQTKINGKEDKVLKESSLRCARKFPYGKFDDAKLYEGQGTQPCERLKRDQADQCQPVLFPWDIKNRYN